MAIVLAPDVLASGWRPPPPALVNATNCTALQKFIGALAQAGLEAGNEDGLRWKGGCKIPFDVLLESIEALVPPN